VIICDTYIGNIFTPNGDGKNDTFEVQGGENFPGSKMQIFNRWGNVVYENENYYNQWIGADNPAATYYYIYTRNDGKVYNGYVMLVKDKE